MKHFTSRQMLLILSFLLPLSRMILFPAALAYLAGTSGIAVVGLCMILELVVCVAVISMWRNSEKSFLDLVSDIFGVVVGKIIAILYVLLFFIKLLLILSSQKLMMYNVLYENVSQYILFLPIILLLGYVGSKNSNSIARVFEISAWCVLGAFVGIMLLATPSVSFDNFFPIFSGGVVPIFKAAYAYPLYFGDFTFFLMFFGSVRKDFSSEWKMLFAWAANFVVTMFFILVFFGVFGTLAAGGTYAISNLSKYAVAFSQIGRYDFLFILVVGFGFILLAIAILHALLFSGEFICGKRWIWSVCAAVVLLFAVKFSSENFEVVMEFFSQYFSAFAIFLQFVLPCVVAIVVKIRSGKRGKMEKDEV